MGLTFPENYNKSPLFRAPIIWSLSLYLERRPSNVPRSISSANHDWSS